MTQTDERTTLLCALVQEEKEIEDEFSKAQVEAMFV